MEWIDVNDRLPEFDQHSMWWNDENDRHEIMKENTHAIVLAFNEIIGTFIAKYDGRWAEVSSCSYRCTSHTIPLFWQPIPQPPQTTK